jgi:hypothetical protein
MLFALASRIFRDLNAADTDDLHQLKQILSAYPVVTDDSLEPLRVTEALDVTQTLVTFGVNTSGMPGADFYLTINSDDSVLYSDGMGENNVPIYPMNTGG